MPSLIGARLPLGALGLRQTFIKNDISVSRTFRPLTVGLRYLILGLRVHDDTSFRSL